MLRIRLARAGRKKRPHYRVVVAEARWARDGRRVDELGYYDPLTDPSTIVLDVARADEWIGKGAQPSERVRKLLDIARQGGPGTRPYGQQPGDSLSAPPPSVSDPIEEPAELVTDRQDAGPQVATKGVAKSKSSEKAKSAAKAKPAAKAKRTVKAKTAAQSGAKATSRAKPKGKAKAKAKASTKSKSKPQVGSSRSEEPNED